MLRSLRSKLILASVLWTTGLLLVIHMFSVMLMHLAPGVMRFHGPPAILFGLLAMAAGLFASRMVLQPFRRLREKLGAVRTGEEPQVAGSYPTEVQPLIDDLNALLQHREKAVKRALSAAGDLAHGLKTPLALLAQDAGRARADGNADLADSIEHHVEAMSRQVAFHLARARAAASGSAGAVRCSVADSAEGLARALEKLYAERHLAIAWKAADDTAVRVQREDLDEMLGNLLDNACKWGKSRVELAAVRQGAEIVITIDDDGPGLPSALRSAVLERGVRADEKAPGSGLGLAIVRDLVELYAGSVRLEDSPLGGLRARLSLPGV